MWNQNWAYALTIYPGRIWRFSLGLIVPTLSFKIRLAVGNHIACECFSGFPSDKEKSISPNDAIMQ